MKKSELKLGDRVLVGGSPIKIDELVEGIDTLSVYDDETNKVKDYSYDDLTPIPLTSEILEKNGWEKDMDGTQCYYFDKYCIRKAHPKEERWMLFLADLFVTSFKHTHELQHLLWALGIDDDLKI